MNMLKPNTMITQGPNVPRTTHLRPRQPIDGGSVPTDEYFETHHPRDKWDIQLKFNGWLGLLHLPSGICYNKKGEEFVIGPKDLLTPEHRRCFKVIYDCSGYRWITLELITPKRTKTCSEGVFLIDIPFVTEKSFDYKRNDLFELARKCRDMTDIKVSYIPECDGHPSDVMKRMKTINRNAGETIWEGFVVKSKDPHVSDVKYKFV